MSFNEVKRCWPDVVWTTNKIGIKTEIWKTDIFKSPQRKSKLSAWLDTTWGNWLLVINQQLLSDVPVCVWVGVLCLCFVYYCVRISTVFFHSTMPITVKHWPSTWNESEYSKGWVCFDPLSWQAHSAVPVFANTLDTPGILHRLIPLLNTSLMYCTSLPLYCLFLPHYMAASAQI